VISEIRIQGLGLIGDAVLEFGPGLTVVTGETGAGKTMVLNGLGLLFGSRADYSRLGPGVETASVEGRLILAEHSTAATVIADAGGELDTDGSLILRRVISSGGRSRAVAGGASVPAGVLARVGEEVLAVHGQSDQQRLVSSAAQRAVLDSYADIDASDVRRAYATWQQLEGELRHRAANGRELAREADLLAHGIAEIEAVAPTAGEDAALEASLTRMEHADALRTAGMVAHNVLLGDPDDAMEEVNAQGALGAARRALSQVAGTDPDLDALSQRLDELLALVAELGSGLLAYSEQLDADPARLAAAQQRRSELSMLTRKYGPDLGAVLVWLDHARERLSTADTSDEALAMLVKERDLAVASYLDHAVAVSAARSKAAGQLSAQISKELAGLGMPGSSLHVGVRHRVATATSPTVMLGDIPVAGGPEGIDDVEFGLQAHPDATRLPIQRGASGGELSRVMLALEVVLAGTDPVPTMVFDEVDAGVGGRAAVEVGQRLARLARDHQVIVVTHLAQVASFADRQLVVDKFATDGHITRSHIRVVEGDERVSELARMLAGDDTEVAREHAAELLATAQAARTVTASTKRDRRRKRGESVASG
jgi:DNA repair protein RecN (Recombination protein N)